jgi:hypothetical protein
VCLVDRCHSIDSVTCRHLESSLVSVQHTWICSVILLHYVHKGMMLVWNRTHNSVIRLYKRVMIAFALSFSWTFTHRDFSLHYY